MQLQNRDTMLQKSTLASPALYILTLAVAFLSVLATSMGIFSSSGPGPSSYTSIRGEKVRIYGEGFYQHMSSEVAPQGIAQDVITLAIGVPLLLLALFKVIRGSLRGLLLLSGVLFYFLVTYLFYTMMGMYSHLYLLHVLLLSCSFFAFCLAAINLNRQLSPQSFNNRIKGRFIGGFLVFCSLTIGLLWLSIIVPPLLQNRIPKEVEHYTTLVVQALDLAILLPLSFISGRLLWKGHRTGYLLATVYIIFLAILMCALTAKVVAMGMLGYKIFPVIFIIPTFTIIAIVCGVHCLKSVRTDNH
jgi:hypothetical protein